MTYFFNLAYFFLLYFINHFINYFSSLRIKDLKIGGFKIKRLKKVLRLKRLKI